MKEKKLKQRHLLVTLIPNIYTTGSAPLSRTPQPPAVVVMVAVLVEEKVEEEKGER